MRKLFKVVIGVIFITIIGTCNCFAYENTDKVKNDEMLEMSYDVYESEDNIFLENIEKNITDNDIEYEFIKIEKNEDEQNSKTVQKQINLLDLTTNNEKKIKSLVDSSYKYQEQGYTGNLSITSIKTFEKDNGTHEEFENMDVPFENLDTNDLSNFDKTIEKNGKVYFLVGVDWEYQTTENIDDTIVPLKYSGIKHYQTIIDIENPKTYNATINYSGKVELEDKINHYKLIYKEVEKEVIPKPEIIEEEKEEEPQNNYVVPVIIISTIGIVLMIVILIYKKKKKDGGKV